MEPTTSSPLSRSEGGPDTAAPGPLRVRTLAVDADGTDVPVDFQASEAGSAFSGGAAPGFWIMTALILGLTVVVAAFLPRIDWI